jgi:hypothetical protein
VAVFRLTLCRPTAGGQQLAQHAAQLRLGVLLAHAEGGELVVPELLHLLGVLAAQMSMMWPAPKVSPLAACTR